MVDANSLSAYYMINSALMLNYKYSLSDIENMLPFERSIYVGLVEKHVKEQNEALEKNKRY